MSWKAVAMVHSRVRTERAPSVRPTGSCKADEQCLELMTTTTNGYRMTLYRGKLETVEAFRYQAGIETMDFKYPFPDWLKDRVTVTEYDILQLDTHSGFVLVKPGQWIVKDKRDNLHILDPEEFHR